MSVEPKALQLSVSLKVLNGMFILSWAFVAIFPFFWVFLMSFKLPLDAFSANPFQVIFGFETMKERGGLSLLQILLWGIAVYFIVRYSRGLTRHCLLRFREKMSLLSSWLVYSSFYCIAFVLLFFVLLPILIAGLSWLCNTIPFLGFLSKPVIGLTLEHYKAVWLDNQFYKNFLNSLLVTAGVVSISLTIGTLAGYGLARSASRLAFWLLITALVFRALPHSVLVTGYLPYFINSKKLLAPLWDSAMSGWFFHLFSDEAPVFYGKPLPVIIVLVAINQPFTIWMLRSFFANIPSELDEAAKVDGCSTIKAFVKVIMPVMWPGVITAGLFSFLLAYNDYLVTALLLDNQSRTMVPAITQYFNRETTATDQIEAVAAASSIVLPLFFLVLVFQKQIVSGLTQGAVKG